MLIWDSISQSHIVVSIQSGSAWGFWSHIYGFPHNIYLTMVDGYDLFWLHVPGITHGVAWTLCHVLLLSRIVVTLCLINELYSCSQVLCSGTVSKGLVTVPRDIYCFLWWLRVVLCVRIGNDMDTTTKYHDHNFWRTSSLLCLGLQYSPCTGVVRSAWCGTVRKVPYL